VGFWFGVVLVTLLLAFKNKGHEDARRRLVEVTDRVAVMVQTLPPKGWREQYATALVEAAETLSMVMPRQRNDVGFGCSDTSTPARTSGLTPVSS
jgi:hypothetical protein